MADATPFADLSRSKLEILLRLSEAALPIWKRFEDAMGDEVPDIVADYIAAGQLYTARATTGVARDGENAGC